MNKILILVLILTGCKLNQMPIDTNDIYISKSQNSLLTRPKKESAVHRLIDFGDTGNIKYYYPKGNTTLYQIKQSIVGCNQNLSSNLPKAICIKDSIRTKEFLLKSRFTKMKRTPIDSGSISLYVVYLKDTIKYSKPYNEYIACKKYQIHILYKGETIFSDLLFSTGDKESITVSECIYYNKGRESFIAGGIVYNIGRDKYDFYRNNRPFIVKVGTIPDAKLNLLKTNNPSGSLPQENAEDK